MADRNPKKTREIDKRLGTLRAELEILSGDVNKVVGDVEGIADNRVHLALRKAEDVAQNAYRLAEESAANVIHDVDDWATDKADKARKSIRAQPFSALAVSAGIGALVGVLFLRR